MAGDAPQLLDGFTRRAVQPLYKRKQSSQRQTGKTAKPQEVN